MTRSLGAIILAAGKGKRMNSQTANKVSALLNNKPMIRHIVEFMEKLQVRQIIVVVGFASESVKDALQGFSITYVQQSEQLGTGHAVEIAMNSIDAAITDVLVVYGDDAVLYNKNNTSIIKDLIKKHIESKNSVTFLTIEQDNPSGLGRILRDSHGQIIGIVEEKVADEEQKKITEINPGCFVFSKEFLKKYSSKIEKNPISGEYYLTDLIDIARNHHEAMDAVRGGKLLWRGVNTPEELAQAEQLISQM